MTTSQGFINKSDLNCYSSSKAVTLVSELNKTRHTSNGTFAHQKPHWERNTHAYAENIWKGLFDSSAFRETRQWLSGPWSMQEVCPVTHNQSKNSTQNPIYNVPLSHLDMPQLNPAAHNITPPCVLRVCSAGWRYGCQSCANTRYTVYIWFRFRNLHHLVNKLLLILRNRHRTFWRVRRYIRQSSCTVGL